MEEITDYEMKRHGQGTTGTRLENEEVRATNKEDLIGKFTVIARNGALVAVKVLGLTPRPDGYQFVMTYEVCEGADKGQKFVANFFSPSVLVFETMEEALQESLEYKEWDHS